MICTEPLSIANVNEALGVGIYVPLWNKGHTLFDKGATKSYGRANNGKYLTDTKANTAVIRRYQVNCHKNYLHGQ